MTLYGMLVLIWMEKVQVYQKVQIKNLTEFHEILIFRKNGSTHSNFYQSQTFITASNKQTTKTNCTLKLYLIYKIRTYIYF